MAAGTPLRRLAARLALRLAARVQPGHDLRSCGRRDRPLAMLWALALSPEARPGLLADAARLRAAGDVVVVTDSLAFDELHLLGCLIETLPGPATRRRLPRGDWPVYAERRIARIRAAWQPDLEVVQGLAPEDFVAGLRAAGKAEGPPPGDAVYDASLQPEA